MVKCNAHDVVVVPADGIHVASNIKAPDGGEDGRIVWLEGPNRTRNLPCRFNQFQLKAGAVTPAQAAKNVLRNGQVQPMVRRALDSGGHYRMLCAHSYTQREIERRTERIRNAIRCAGGSAEDNQVTFWDADQIAAWVNRHSAVAMWVRACTQRGTVGPFQTWEHWADHPDHDKSPWVFDERLPPLRDRLRELATPQSIVRLVGLSGVGKSRLALEALGTKSTSGDRALSDIVMYADESEADASAIIGTVKILASTGTRAVVVVNRCSPRTHRILAGNTSRASSGLSLLTLDDDIPATTPDQNTAVIEHPAAKVVEAIIKGLLPNSPPMDHQRLAHFAQRFPRIAIDIAKAWRSSQPIAHAEDDDIVDAFVLGRQARDPDHTRKAAMLVAAFDEMADEPRGGDLEEVATFHHDLGTNDLHIGIKRLVERGVVRRQGVFLTLQPLPIAMRLAERQWEDWSKEQWDRLLASEGSRRSQHLASKAARMLARLDTTPIAKEVVHHICRQNGPLAGVRALAFPVGVLPYLAEVAPSIVVQRIEGAMHLTDDLTALARDARRDVVSALERIAFHADVFHRAARLLLRFAASEYETASTRSATDAFLGLFRVRLGNTAADGPARLTFLDAVLETADTAERIMVAKALTVCLTPQDWRMVGAEVQGSKPALPFWFPSKDAEIEHVTACLSRLARIAAKESADSATARARSDLGARLSFWIAPDYIDALEAAIRAVSSVAGAWPEAVESLGHALESDAQAHGTETVRRVEALLRALDPARLEDRIRLVVTAMPGNYPAGEEELDWRERDQKQQEAVRALARDLGKTPRILKCALPQLSRGEQRQAQIFGEALGDMPSLFKPFVWRRQITRAALQTPEEERNLSLLIGYSIGIAKRHPRLANPLKRRLAQSSDLVTAFTPVCAGLGVQSSDVELAVDALKRGVLPPRALSGWAWHALRSVPPSDTVLLFDALLGQESDEALAAALDLMAAQPPAVRDGLGPQIRRCVARCVHYGGPAGYTSHLFERLVGRMLGKGREDADACGVALDLATMMVERGELPGSLGRQLLADFPEIVWPQVGAAIIADSDVAWRMQLALSGWRSYQPLILALPLATLLSWCRAHPTVAPAFAASVLPVLAQGDEQILHPSLQRLIDEFGEREDVLDGVKRNIGTNSWVGSMTGYYQQFLAPLKELANHRITAVARWAAHMTRILQANVEKHAREDAELEAQRSA